MVNKIVTNTFIELSFVAAVKLRLVASCLRYVSKKNSSGAQSRNRLTN